jgi:hypothetical protein
MAGWTPPPGSAPVVGWDAPDEPEGLGVRESTAEGWRLTMANLGPLAALGVIPAVVWSVALVPLWIAIAQMYEQLFTFWTTVDWTTYADDPEGFQTAMQAALQPSTELWLLGTVSAGVGIVVAFVGLAALTSATLTAADGHRPTVGGAIRAVMAHVGDILAPALVIGVGYILVSLPTTLNQGAFYGGASASTMSLAFVYTLLSLVVWVGAFVLAVRWALVLQVIFAEGLDLGPALVRSAALSSGVRVRIGLTLIVLSFLVGLVVWIVGGLLALVVGVAAWSVTAAVIAFSVAVIICGVVFVPLFAAVLTSIYRRRVRQLAGGASPSAPAPASPDQP